MYVAHNTLQELGFSQWFGNRLDQELMDDCQLARVSAVNKESYIINNEYGEVQAEITGKMMFGAQSPLDYPTVGDWVYAQYLDDNSLAIIHGLVPRKTILQRKTSGKKIELQLIAANIDTAFIMQSLDANFSIPRLERYLVMARQGGIEPVLLLSKSDLMEDDEIASILSSVRDAEENLTVRTFSNVDESGLSEVKGLLGPRQTYCLLGSSGVGKTTLLNNLIGKVVFDTQAVRQYDSKGRHVTTRRQLIMLDQGAMIIDTPGMRELGNFGVEAGLAETFGEIDALAAQCRFGDCTHSNEKGCAVLAALEAGDISDQRYGNYIKMQREDAYLQSSYLEKRRKDKEFGKMIKRVMKQSGRK